MCLNDCSGKYYFGLDTCVDNCSGMFLYGTDRCLSTCAGKVQYGNSCFDSCPGGTYDPGNAMCMPCDPICSACAGTPTNCVNCGVGQIINTVNGQCVSTCPTGTYEGWTDDDPNRRCLPCTLKGCTLCTANNNVVTCTACLSHLYLKPAAGTCIEAVECLSPFILLETPSKNCVFCHHSCATCDGTSQTSCLTCPSIRLYKPDTKECLTSCPGTGYFRSGS